MKEYKNVVQVKSYDYSILIYRLLALFFILACHIGTEINNGFIAQFFDTGVQFFLFISGYLYANRIIRLPLKWLADRYCRVSIPCILYVVFCIIISGIMKWDYSKASIFLYISNTEGYYHLIEFLPKVTLVAGTQHLWFVTALFLNYLLTVAIKKKKTIDNLFNSKLYLTILIITSLLAAYFGVRLDYVLIYFIGYYISYKAIEPNKTHLFASLVFMIIAVVARLAFKVYCDYHGDNAIYTQIIIPIAYIAITVFFFFLIKIIVGKIEKNSLFLQIMNSKGIKQISDLSFYVYVSHYLLLGNEFSAFKTGTPIWLSIILFFFESIVAGIVLRTISEPISRRCKKLFNLV